MSLMWNLKETLWKKLIEFFESEEKKKQNELIQYEDYAQIDETDIKQKVSKCDTEIENLQELKKQVSILKVFLKKE